MNKTQSEWDSRKVELNSRLNTLLLSLNGGKGSGNFGHKGRPGVRGGSGDGKGMTIDDKTRAKMKSEAVKKIGINSRKAPEKLDDYQTSVGTGVNGDQSYGTGLRKIDRVSKKNLTEEQKNLQEEICDVYEDPTKLASAMDAADGYMQGKYDAKREKGQDVLLTYETDAIKQALPGWGTDDRYDYLKDKVGKTPEEQQEFDGYRKNRQENNTLYHNTANAIAKAAFERKVQNSASSTGDNIIVTAGGCGSGKGFGLGEIAQGGGVLKEKTSGAKNAFYEDYKKSSLVWDAAGDQCSSELNWLNGLAKAYGKKLVILQTNNSNPDIYNKIAENQLGRANNEGRMVASKISGDSYELGNKNIEAFAKATKGDTNIKYYTIDNGGSKKIPTELSSGLHTNKVDGKKMSDTIQAFVSSSPDSNAEIIAGAKFL